MYNINVVGRAHRNTLCYYTKQIKPSRVGSPETEHKFSVCEVPQIDKKMDFAQNCKYSLNF